VLSALLLYGLLELDFEIRPRNVAAILVSAQLAQWTLTRLFRLPRFDPRSALISSLSLCLLLRTHSLALAARAALTIASKFLIRAPSRRTGGKHVFNPANFGLVTMMLLADGAWVSPGQWGSAAFAGFLVACLGGLVVHRAERSDVTWAFVIAYAALLFGRAAWLGDPLAIPLHQLENGAFLIFAFFMISDPKTTPDSRPGRILYAAVVASVAVAIQFGLYQPNALIWALAACAPLVPLADRLLPGARYRWARPAAEPPKTPLLPAPLSTEAA
jgi:Na+-transporting NADH:ubiquinone oxidoreductase subunit NqrB